MRMREQLSRLAVGMTALVISLFTFASDVYACRDCPFPMKVAEGRWLMPNRHLEVEIEETRLAHRFTKVDVALIDAQTGEIMAVGSIRLRTGQKSAYVQMLDLYGHPVHAHITWLNKERDQVQIELSCQGECSISNLL